MMFPPSQLSYQTLAHYLSVEEVHGEFYTWKYTLCMILKGLKGQRSRNQDTPVKQ